MYFWGRKGRGIALHYNINAGSERGAAFAEGLFAIPFFLFILLIGIDLMRVLSIQARGNQVVNRTMRWAILQERLTGVRDLNDGLGPRNVLLSREESIEEKLIQYAVGHGLVSDPNSVDRSTITICKATQLNCNPDQAGTDNELIVITWRRPVAMLIWPIGFPFEFQAIGKNESSS